MTKLAVARFQGGPWAEPWADRWFECSGGRRVIVHRMIEGRDMGPICSGHYERWLESPPRYKWIETPFGTPCAAGMHVDGPWPNPEVV